MHVRNFVNCAYKTPTNSSEKKNLQAESCQLCAQLYTRNQWFNEVIAIQAKIKHAEGSKVTTYSKQVYETLKCKQI